MLEGLTPPTRLFSCAVRSLNETLEEKDRVIFQYALDDTDSWKAKTLSRALRDRNIIISDDAISRHRRGQCSC